MMNNVALKEIQALRTTNIACIDNLIHYVANPAAKKYVTRAARYVAGGRDQREVCGVAEVEAVISRAEVMAVS